MKSKTLARRLGIAVGLPAVAALVAGGVLLARSLGSSAEHATGTAKTAGPVKQRYKPVPGLQMSTAEVAESVDELLREGSGRAWQKLAALYKGADETTKRRILESAAKQDELKRALGYVLATVGDDLVPLEEDRMIAEAAQLLRQRWVEPKDLERGRELMLMQKTEKRQWVLAKAMIDFAASRSASSEFETAKLRFTASLVDFHAAASSDFLRAEIAAGVRKLGNSDLARLLEQGPNLNVEQLEVVKAERAAAEQAMAELAKQRK